MTTQNPVRTATEKDIPAIQSLLRHYADMGDLLPRNEADIIANLPHFSVVAADDQIIACGSLEHFTHELAEIRSLMVKETHKGLGLGRVIVDSIINTAQQRKVSRLMALTYVPNFFHKMGFITVNKEIFPEKVWGICVNCYKFHNCDETAVLLALE